MNSIVGIDLGTTNIKVVAFDTSGDIRAMATRQTTIHYPDPSDSSRSEFDVEAIWADVCSCIAEVAASPACGTIESIGITSFGESNVLIDREGVPIFPMITWFDQRTIEQAHLLEHTLGARTLHHITGQFVSTKMGICKVMWVKQHYPEVFDRAHQCLTMHDYIAYKLTGVFATDYSMASRMMCFDIHTLQWSDTILEAAGIPRRLFPKIQPGGSLIGTILPDVAKATGLDLRTPVHAGGHDHPCAAAAVGVFDDGVALDSMGTAETTLIATDTLPDMDRCFGNQISVYPHFGKKLYRVTSSIHACGACIQWASDMFLQPAHPNLPSVEAFEYYLRESETDPACENLIFVPNLRGLQEQPHARGAFFGIDDTCNLNSFARAIAEGLSFEMRRRLDGCLMGLHLTPDTIRIVGGPSNSIRQVQIKANILDRQVQVPQIKDAACYGTALIAACGAGVLSGLPSFDRYIVINPQPDKTEHLDRKYSLYLTAHACAIQYSNQF